MNIKLVLINMVIKIVKINRLKNGCIILINNKWKFVNKIIWMK